MFLELNDAKIYYEIKGEGTPVILIHGFPFNTEMWEEQVKFLSNKGFKVITLDLRGHGKSTGIPETIEQMGNDIISLIEYLKLNKPIIVGMSMGGYIAFDLSVRFHEKFTAGIFISTKAEGDNDNVKDFRNKLISDIKKTGSITVADFYMPKLFSTTTEKTNPDLINTVKSWILNSSSETLTGATKAMRDRNNNTKYLNKIKFPSLIIAGKEDPMIPEEVVKKECQLLSNCKFEIIQDAGHMANMEKPGITNEIISDFLRNLK